MLIIHEDHSILGQRIQPIPKPTDGELFLLISYGYQLLVMIGWFADKAGYVTESTRGHLITHLPNGSWIRWSRASKAPLWNHAETSTRCWPSMNGSCGAFITDYSPWFIAVWNYMKDEDLISVALESWTLEGYRSERRKWEHPWWTDESSKLFFVLN